MKALLLLALACLFPLIAGETVSITVTNQSAMRRDVKIIDAYGPLTASFSVNAGDSQTKSPQKDLVKGGVVQLLDSNLELEQQSSLPNELDSIQVTITAAGHLIVTTQ